MSLLCRQSNKWGPKNLGLNSLFNHQPVQRVSLVVRSPRSFGSGVSCLPDPQSPELLPNHRFEISNTAVPCDKGCLKQVEVTRNDFYFSQDIRAESTENCESRECEHHDDGTRYKVQKETLASSQLREVQNSWTTSPKTLSMAQQPNAGRAIANVIASIRLLWVRLFLMNPLGS